MFSIITQPITPLTRGNKPSQICSFLHPKDMLHLSRTSKGLRQIFMSRHSLGVWRAVLASLDGLPPCPDDLSEPAYASLIFDQYCHVCDDPTNNLPSLLNRPRLTCIVQVCKGDDGFTVHWQCRMRMCHRCLAHGCVCRPRYDVAFRLTRFDQRDI